MERREWRGRESGGERRGGESRKRRGESRKMKIEIWR